MPAGRSRSNSELELVITREFAAPRALVWKAWTDPAHVACWFGPRGFTTRVEELDLRPGGRSRYVMVGPDGAEYPCFGVFREVVPMERIVTTDEFEEGPGSKCVPDLPSGMVVTALFEDAGAGTRLTLRIMHPTIEDRRKHEAMGVFGGWHSSFDCLDEHLESLGGGIAAARRIVVTRMIEAPVALVWKAWTEKEHTSRWICPEDCTVLSCEAEVRVGGEYRESMRCKGEVHTVTGVYREIAPEQRLVFTHRWDEPDAPETVVVVEFRAKGRGTEIVLTQTNLRNAASAKGHEGGWTSALSHLATHLAKRQTDFAATTKE